ncbi:hypothetical protein R5R35_001411 [Gryllus longicercus]|uniref:PX domain-containing protein n=1 Tax=Gryllus longicercus TaxID=2509291 RepID=A0AAN9VMW1_9ORTH|nr:Sorting nexin-24 [Gryllus bimaculatus]
MIHVYIPRYRLVDELPDKPHYVYVVEIFDSGKHYKAERRYSAFHCLHRELRKNYSTPVFPPKRVRSCQTKVLERRRQCLEQYLQVMLRFGPCRDQVLAFLGITKTRTSEEQEGTAVGEKALNHQPIYIYKKDPFLEYERKSSLPDIVTEGVLMALYGKSQ